MWSEKLEKFSKTNLVEWERVCNDFWKEKDIPRKSITIREGLPEYTFYDGPITANNRPHYGHALTMTLKDVIPRFRSMKGYHVMRSLGWDCQGIPVEYEVEKKLAFKEKKEIEAFGVEKFNQLCRESVQTYQSAIRDLTDRMGRWVLPDEEYATMNPEYIESIWWSLSELYKKGLLYLGYKVVPYSTRAGTSLSNAEVALGGYKPIVDTAVVAAFHIPAKNWYALAWTTTPWTLPGNLLLAIKEDATYATVSEGGKTYLCAKDRVKALFEGREYNVESEVTGKELIDLEYEPLFPYYADRKTQGAYKIVSAEHVTTDDGTGLVHLAPYGEEDFAILQKRGIELFDYLDEQGHFTKDIPFCVGQFYKGAKDAIFAELEKNGNLFSHAEYEHEMPMCWRTDTPLIYKPVKSWYVKVTAIKDLLVSENKQVEWMPESFKEGRFGNWLENAHDWALSRKRYWGTPLPIWMCETCAHTEVLGSFAEIKEKTGIQVEDPHKPFVDAITYTCPTCGATMKRDPDVIDVWYDSGAMPFARLHYPFENKELFTQKYPAAYIAEGTDQTRGWFYSMHVLNVALFGKKAFEHVIVNGMFLAADGKKLSKSKKNYTDYELLLDKYGGDVVRLYFLSTPIAKAESVIFSEKQLDEMNARAILPMVNLVKYFLTYASLANWEFSDKVGTSFFDSWLVARTKEVATKMTAGFEKYDVQEATLEFLDLIDEISKWYIHANRDRFVQKDSDALATLYWALRQLTLLAAPIVPFLSELFYRDLWVEPKESVHYEEYPSFTLAESEVDILTRMQKARVAITLGLSLREEAGIRVRQPLLSAKVTLDDKELLPLIAKELNVKECAFVDTIDGEKVKTEGDLSIWLDTEVSEELHKEGLFKDIVRAVQFHRKQTKCAVGEEKDYVAFSSDPMTVSVITTEAAKIKEVTKTTLSVVSEQTEAMQKYKTSNGDLWLA